MPRDIATQVEAELEQIGRAMQAEPPSETLDELVARKRREQGICIEEAAE